MTFFQFVTIINKYYFVTIFFATLIVYGICEAIIKKRGEKNGIQKMDKPY